MGIAVPGQLSVAGFDDTPLAAMTVPPLASVHVPWDRMAQHAVTGFPGVSQPFPEETAFEAPTFDARHVLRASVAAIEVEAPAIQRSPRAVPQV
jgi:LacI family transcriptional regulator